MISVTLYCTPYMAETIVDRSKFIYTEVHWQVLDGLPSFLPKLNFTSAAASFIIQRFCDTIKFCSLLVWQQYTVAIE